MGNKYKQWFTELRCKKAAQAFTDKGWNVFYAESKEEAKKLLFETIIPKDVSVGLGGSETLTAMDVLSQLRNGNYKFFDRYNCADHFEVCRDSLLADVFLTSANALTMKGEMVNIDCSGSRVAAMAYGPRKIIVAAGANKLCDTLDEAINRAYSIAPMNCKRNNHATPCVENGECNDCNIQARMCNHLMITLNAKKFPGRFTLVLINEDLGF